MAYDRIFEIMKEKELTAYRVSKDTGISQASLADWRKGRSKPKIDKLQKLSEYFGVSIQYLTGESDQIDDTQQIQAPNGYYVDKETAEYAEMLRTRPGARLLFSAAKDISKDDLQKAVEYIEFLKSKNK
ncbi:helix-turn-helix transcriptional regulator [Veillonella sp.]|uniref:helix-turn-helix domain-containing protein n=1 Tax=Veillonella sp. TaxID=1926307 RepID=UPI00290D3119|nr:helix-turn-helix transcriptional regulator [Veillonella sp.]MDU4116223.1 helix-turn-helix transcriptional regulator [Veillonella sp.]